MQSQKNRKLHFFLRIFDEFFSGFRAKFQKIVTCAAFSIKFAKTNQKFAENSEFCEKNSLLLVNYSLHSLLVRQSQLEARLCIDQVATAGPHLGGVFLATPACSLRTSR